MPENGPLRAALLRAHARWSTRAEERFPTAGEWVPLAGTVGSDEASPDQRLTAEVPTVPTVPTEKQDIAQASPPLTPDEEERAAILEFEAGLDRATAERLAQGRLPDWGGS